MMPNNFLKTNEGKQIILFEDRGYRLTDNQNKLTIPQELFLFYGWKWLDKEKEKEINKHSKSKKGR